MKEWLEIACDMTVVNRAVKYAIIVGPILVLINHGDSLFTANLTAATLSKIGLTIVVPYLVSTCSSVGANLAARQRADGTASR